MEEGEGRIGAVAVIAAGVGCMVMVVALLVAEVLEVETIFGSVGTGTGKGLIAVEDLEVGSVSASDTGERLTIDEELEVGTA